MLDGYSGQLEASNADSQRRGKNEEKYVPGKYERQTMNKLESSATYHLFEKRGVRASHGLCCLKVAERLNKGLKA